LVTGAGTPVLK